MKAKDRLPVFSERLRKITNEQDLSVTALSNLAGIAQPSLSMYLSGDRLPDAEVITRLCRALNVSADWLLGLSDVRTLDANARAAALYTGLSVGVIEQLRHGTAHTYNDSLIRSIINALSDSLNINQEQGVSNGNV